MPHGNRRRRGRPRPQERSRQTSTPPTASHRNDQRFPHHHNPRRASIAGSTLDHHRHRGRRLSRPPLTSASGTTSLHTPNHHTRYIVRKAYSGLTASVRRLGDEIDFLHHNVERLAPDPDEMEYSPDRGTVVYVPSSHLQCPLHHQNPTQAPQTETDGSHTIRSSSEGQPQPQTNGPVAVAMAPSAPFGHPDIVQTGSEAQAYQAQSAFSPEHDNQPLRSIRMPMLTSTPRPTSTCTEPSTLNAMMYNQHPQRDQPLPSMLQANNHTDHTGMLASYPDHQSYLHLQLHGQPPPGFMPQHHVPNQGHQNQQQYQMPQQMLQPTQHQPHVLQVQAHSLLLPQPHSQTIRLTSNHDPANLWSTSNSNHNGADNDDFNDD